MKKLIKPINVILILFVGFSLTHCGGTKKAEETETASAEPLKIDLNVNTADIVKPDLEPYCSFEGQKPGVADSTFTILVSNGDKIRWKGVSTSSKSDRVKIKAIDHVYGKNLLSKIVLLNDGAEIEATVENGISDDIMKYSISFEVYIKGKQKDSTFVIDPKLRIK